MQLQGTITSIVPDGGYQSSQGYIHTFQIGIQTAAGTYCGQIGSKTATYPLAVGQPIIVEATNTAHGVRFKKVNPKFAGQAAPAQSLPQPAAAPLPQPQGKVVSQPQKQPASNIDWDGKDQRMANENALTNATRILCTLAEILQKGDECTPANAKIVAMTFVDWIYNYKAKKNPNNMTTDELLSQPASFDTLLPEDSYGDRN